MDTSYFRDQNALITGASSGIGAEFARQLHAVGARVVLVARRRDQLAALANELNDKRPASAEYLVIDLTQNQSISQEGQRGIQGGLLGLIDYIQKNRVDILVNNAGRGSFGYFEELSISEELDMVALNVAAPLRLTHAVIPQMKQRRRGAIISISSIAGFQPLPYMATYSATKAFDFTHGVALHFELREFGVRALTVCPGPTETEFSGVARIPGKITSSGRDSVEVVVAKSLRALAKNRVTVVPGLHGATLGLVSRLLPIRLATWAAHRMLKPTLLAVRANK